MNIVGPFIINDISYTKEELIAYSFKALELGKLDDWESDIYQFILAFFDEEITLSQRSSGTTGDPKTIELHRDSMVNSAKMTIENFKLIPGDRILLCLPVQYIAGKMMLVRALVGRLNLVTVEPSGQPISNLNFAYWKE